MLIPIVTYIILYIYGYIYINIVNSYYIAILPPWSLLVWLRPSIRSLRQLQREATAPEAVPVSVLDMALLRAESRFFGAQRQPGDQVAGMVYPAWKMVV